MRFSFLLALTSSAALASPDLGHIQSLVAQGPGVLVASDTGLYFAGHDGRIVQRGTRQGGFSALVADRADPQRLYASTPDTPVLRSTNGGRQWQAVSGLGAKPFTILSAGPAGSDILYGVADGIYRSADEGRHWTRSGDLPEKTITVAASPTTAGTLFAGTMTGLVVSRDDGATWTRQSAGKGPTTLVEPGPGGGFLSFAWGRGCRGWRSRVRRRGH
ncbi:hypothetical protein G3580_09850 [Nitrogeniibacter mangrovi]|uniref:Photosynthesis system II assembly factor Ycf48/Hcf136-like domain-containing protein n=1 Tax=Nitrogeniibacter mangrovi TaxID=2016596 RepID=A0A6C1B2Q0_9RHOO|nr:hypothetical protein [Nitrogeniibacter mangrovi]QID17916.1 hypothetical protein G3580_09850 [Nitrogeniibacter mangrovi]